MQIVKHLSQSVVDIQYMQRLLRWGTGGVEPPTKEQIEACVPEVRMDKDFILCVAHCYMKSVTSHKYSQLITNIWLYHYILVVVRNGCTDCTSKNETNASVYRHGKPTRILIPEEETCAVCLESIEVDQTARKLQCNHVSWHQWLVVTVFEPASLKAGFKWQSIPAFEPTMSPGFSLRVHHRLVHSPLYTSASPGTARKRRRNRREKTEDS